MHTRLRKDDAHRGCCTAAGYIGSASLLKTIARLVDLLRKHNTDLIYSEPSAIHLPAHLPFP